MSDLVLEIKDVSKTFRHHMNRKKTKVVKNLNCGFLKGQCTGFLGHNGAGKTTTLKMIIGLITPDSGEILLNGKTLERQDRANIGYLPESDRLPMTLNAAEVLSLHLRMIGRSFDKKPAVMIQESLEKVSLWEARKVRIGKMSKGMRRRLAWAMATIHQPELFILDEPFSGLDPVARRDMRTWINDLKVANKSLVLCTHELWTMPLLCDQVYIMKKGELVYSSDKHPGSGATFHLSFSGTDVENVKKISNQLKLAEPAFLNQSGYVVEMGFKDYSLANQYLKTGLEAGLVLVEFNGSKVVSESEALKFF